MRRLLLTILIFLLAGAVVNVAVAWGCIAAQSTPWDEVEVVVAPDTDWLWANGIAIYDVLEEQRLRQFGLLDSEYSAQVEEPTDRTSGYYLYARRTRCGWPFLSLDGGRGSTIEFVEARGRYWFTDVFYIDALSGDEPASLLFGNGGAMLGDLEYLPLGPIWPGFAVDTLFYAATLWLLICGPFALRRFIRVKRGLCPKCAYPMGDSPVCTECGKPLPRRARPAT
jgi:hypothetical protein